jgi:hypothetical protein
LPLAGALWRSRAGIGVLVTYMTSMSLLSFVRVPLEMGIYAARLTGLRVAACVSLATDRGCDRSRVSRAR